MNRTNDNLMIRPSRGSATRSWRRVRTVLGGFLMLSSLLAAPAIAGSPIVAATAAGQPGKVENSDVHARAPEEGTLVDAAMDDGPDDAAAITFKCKGLTATIVGTNGKDTLRGTPKRDVIVGRGGNDAIDGGGGADVICAGSGNDTVNGGKGKDFIDLGSGNDTGRGGKGKDTILGGAGNDRIYGESGNDTLRGGSGNDTINGGVGNDTINGGAGNDKLLGQAGRDLIFGGDGNDRIEGGGGNDKLHGEKGSDLIKGGRGVDLMYGGAGHDLLDGMSGGGSANGGAGHDACYNATQPEGSGCEKDQLWRSSSSSIETSDLTEIATDRGGYAVPSSMLSVQINGKTYRRGLGCAGLDRRFAFCEWEYNLSREYTRFAAYVGTDDRSESTAVRILVEVIGDNDVIISREINFGERQRIVANVSNVLRLRLRMTALEGPGGTVTRHFFTDPRVSQHPGLYPADPIP